MKVRFKQLHPDAILPSYAKEGDGGLDLTAVELIKATQFKLTYNFGLSTEIPEGHVGLIFPRSSIRKKALSLTNSVGMIDSGYRGPVQATFRKDAMDFDDEEDYKVGERIAQLFIISYPKIEPEWAEELTETDRGEGGFGSTGK